VDFMLLTYLMFELTVFVSTELRKFMKLGPTGQPPTYSKVELAKAVLAELPAQVVEWMSFLNNPPA